MTVPLSPTLPQMGEYAVPSLDGAFAPLMSVKYIEGLSLPLCAVERKATLTPSGPITGLQLVCELPVGIMSVIDCSEILAREHTLIPLERFTARNSFSLIQEVM